MGQLVNHTSFQFNGTFVETLCVDMTRSFLEILEGVWDIKRPPGRVSDSGRQVEQENLLTLVHFESLEPADFFFRPKA
jgi:hypothetical protein